MFGQKNCTGHEIGEFSTLEDEFLILAPQCSLHLVDVKYKQMKRITALLT